MFTQSQLKQLSDRGITEEQALQQLGIFKKGIAPVRLARPAVPNNGIEIFGQKEIDYYKELFRKEKKQISIIKFVPASGAASRMFKQLFEAKTEFINNSHDPSVVFTKLPEIEKFYRDLKTYPFYDDLVKVCKEKGKDPESMIKSEKYAELLDVLLSGSGLSYGELPKGLLKFHRYSDETRTAFEEHFVEASRFLGDRNNVIKMHFTVSAEHKKLFEKLADELIKKYSSKYNVNFKVDFSVQKPSTDTLAVDLDNNPFVQDNKILFRPGGHGALLENMQDIDEQMIFVGNIDNVSPDKTKKLRVSYKELLGGILIERIHKIHGLLSRLDEGYSEELKNEIHDFVNLYISTTSAAELVKYADNEFVDHVKNILNRPVRVCGMVKNAGEPGGGPFWISDKNGNISKQVVESSQVNLVDPKQKKIFSEATHFNPVDMVCYTSSFRGEKFRLENYRDQDMAFIALKSQGSNTLKALELPGLWNGSMAGWLTFFVDVPVETFSPVKTIFDLLREEHLS